MEIKDTDFKRLMRLFRAILTRRRGSLGEVNAMREMRLLAKKFNKRYGDGESGK